MEPFPQLTPPAQSSNASILLKITQLSQQYINFIASLNFSPEQTEKLNLNRFNLAQFSLQKLISAMSFLNDAEARLKGQKQISGALDGLEGYFQCENQMFITSSQAAQEYTKVMELYREIKNMLSHANLIAPQAAASLYDDKKSLSKRTHQVADIAEDYDEHVQRRWLSSMPV